MQKPDNDHVTSKESVSLPPRGFRSAEEALSELITEAATPRLFALLEQDGEGGLQQELLQLVRVFVPPRAKRQKVRVVAKILRAVGATEVEDPVVVRDISVSGAQIAISAQVGLMAQDLTHLTLRLRFPGQKDVDVLAHLARVVRVDERYIVVGVRFVNLPKWVEGAIHDIGHSHSLRASQLAELRLSRSPATARAEVDTTRPRPALGPRLK